MSNTYFDVDEDDGERETRTGDADYSEAARSIPRDCVIFASILFSFSARGKRIETELELRLDASSALKNGNEQIFYFCSSSVSHSLASGTGLICLTLYKRTILSSQLFTHYTQQSTDGRARERFLAFEIRLTCRRAKSRFNQRY